MVGGQLSGGWGEKSVLDGEARVGEGVAAVEEFSGCGLPALKKCGGVHEKFDLGHRL